MPRLQPSMLTIPLLLLSAAALADPDPKLIATCNACHGDKGISTAPTTPSVAGISATTLTTALKSYKARTRPCGSPDMCGPSAGLSDADIAALADYYSKLGYVKTRQAADAAKVAAGKAIAARNCEGCHSKGGSDPADDAGLLAGQPVGWLKSTLQAHKAGQVAGQDKLMKQKLSGLSEADLDALAQYYGSL